jgi:hypothetical protein
LDHVKAQVVKHSDIKAQKIYCKSQGVIMLIGGSLWAEIKVDPTIYWKEQMSPRGHSELNFAGSIKHETHCNTNLLNLDDNTLQKIYIHRTV